ncbi:MAG: O-methyltransferase [Flavisolibacter sp.]
MRRKMLSDKRSVIGMDYGAGSRKKNNEKSVSDIARSALKPKTYAELFYRMVKHYQPSTILELGTSLGITTAYLHSGNPDAQIFTIEGNKAIADIAKENFQKLEVGNTEVIIGNFNDVLPQLLQNNPVIDFAFIDGNHRFEPTLQYFHQLLECSHAQTILVFDDIHWSSEMEQAWKKIREHPRVVYTIDIFFLGFVFFREEFKVKQNFTIRF